MNDTIIEDQYIIYPYRWCILSLFCLLVMSNALLWVTFAPISDLVSSYFGTDSYYGSTTSVNMLANIFLILYGPGGLTLIGSFIRYMAALNHKSLSNENKYILFMIGQAFGGISQPMLLNSPPLIASIWFAVKERDLATTIGSMCSPIGNAIGQIIPVLLVSGKTKSDDDDDDYNVKGMNDLMLIEFILCIIPFILAMIFLKDSPLTPPSKSTKLKNENFHRSLLITSSNENDNNNNNNNNNSFKTTTSSIDNTQYEYTKIYDDIIELYHNQDYILLFFAFSIGVGFFNSLLTLLNQLVAPFGYSNDNAGTFGALFIVFGLVGAGIISYIMEHTRAYRTILKCGVLASVFACILFISMLYSNNFWPLAVAFSILGSCILPLLPVMMENCAECTYPISEDLSMGILFVGSNIIGLGFIFALQYLIEEPSFGPPPLLPSNVFILGIIIIAFIIVMLYQGSYKRLQNESLHDQLLDQSNSLLPNNSLHNQTSTTTINTRNQNINIYSSTHSPMKSPGSLVIDGTIVHISSIPNLEDRVNDNSGVLSIVDTNISADHNLMSSTSMYAWRNNSQSTNSQTLYSQNSSAISTNTITSVIHGVINSNNNRPPVIPPSDDHFR